MRLARGQTAQVSATGVLGRSIGVVGAVSSKIMGVLLGANSAGLGRQKLRAGGLFLGKLVLPVRLTLWQSVRHLSIVVRPIVRQK